MLAFYSCMIALAFDSSSEDRTDFRSVWMGALKYKFWADSCFL